MTAWIVGAPRPYTLGELTRTLRAEATAKALSDRLHASQSEVLRLEKECAALRARVDGSNLGEAR